MTAENHPDPFQDAIGNGVQRAVQVTSCAVTAAQVYLHQQRVQAMATAERDERARRAREAIASERGPHYRERQEGERDRAEDRLERAVGRARAASAKDHRADQG